MKSALEVWRLLITAYKTNLNLRGHSYLEIIYNFCRYMYILVLHNCQDIKSKMTPSLRAIISDPGLFVNLMWLRLVY